MQKLANKRLSFQCLEPTSSRFSQPGFQWYWGIKWIKTWAFKTKPNPSNVLSAQSFNSPEDQSQFVKHLTILPYHNRCCDWNCTLNTFYLGLYFRKTHKSSVLDGHLSCPQAFPQHAKILQPVQLELLSSLSREGSQFPCQWTGHPSHQAIRDGALPSWADSNVFQWQMHDTGSWILCSDMLSHQWNPTGNGDVKINLRHIWLLLVILRGWGWRVSSHWISNHKVQSSHWYLTVRE